MSLKGTLLDLIFIMAPKLANLKQFPELLYTFNNSTVKIMP